MKSNFCHWNEISKEISYPTERRMIPPVNPPPNNSIIFAPLPPSTKTDNIFNLGILPVKNSNQQLTIKNPDKS